ncbi:MAG: hypothetical protein VYA69_03335 [Gemmatimonadota bacterium]|nr:hypothetical protein [Gemmatimonadota bacterium]
MSIGGTEGTEPPPNWFGFPDTLPNSTDVLTLLGEGPGNDRLESC